MSRPSPIRLALVTVALSVSAAAQPPAAPAGAPAAAAPAKVGPSPYSEAVQKGDSAYVARDFDGAIASYRKEIEKNPNAALGHYRLGEAELAKGDFAEAEQSFQNALRFAGKDERMKGKVLFVLADLKERQKAYEDAVTRWKDYQQQAQSQPDAKGFPATAVERIKRADEWKKISADAAEVKARIDKRVKEADEAMKKSSK